MIDLSPKYSQENNILTKKNCREKVKGNTYLECEIMSKKTRGNKYIKNKAHRLYSKAAKKRDFVG
jgi:fructose/tagatose bisphosphate aldolase